MNVIDRKLALEKLKSGLPIIFHTDTLPAIGCLPKFSEIIYKIKKRDKNKPLILMGAENYQLEEFVHKSAMEDYKIISSKYCSLSPYFLLTFIFISPISLKIPSLIAKVGLSLARFFLRL